MKEAGSSRDNRMDISVGVGATDGGSDTRATCRKRMKKVEKNIADGEVVKRYRRARGVTVTMRRGHRESWGQDVSSRPERKVKDWGKAVGKPTDWMP